MIDVNIPIGVQIPFDVNMEIQLNIAIVVDRIHKRTCKFVAVVKHSDVDGICGDLMMLEKFKLLDDVLCMEDYKYY